MAYKTLEDIKKNQLINKIINEIMNEIVRPVKFL